MKKLLITLSCFLLMLALVGCGQQEAETDTGAAGEPEELADDTRLDSAAGAIVDSAEAVVDSLAEEAGEAAKDAVDDVVEEVTGN